MSLLFCDNFSNYGPGSGGIVKALDGIYAEEALASFETDPDGVSSGYVLKARDLRKVISQGVQTTLGVAFRHYPSSLPSDGGNYNSLLYFNDSDNVRQIELRCNTSGVLNVYRGDYVTGTLLGSTSVPVITAHTWQHIEMKVFFSQTVGTVEIRVNEVPVLTLTGVDTCKTAEVGCAQIVLANYTNTACYKKDFLMWNDQGSVNNDFMGDWSVVTSAPTADDSFNWAASTGSTGYNLIDETTPDDADYIYADDTPPAASTFALADLSIDVVQVAAVQTMARMMKTDSGSAHAQVSMVSGASSSDGADRAMTVTETYYPDVHELDPNTGTAWTRISFNNSKIKVNRIS